MAEVKAENEGKMAVVMEEMAVLQVMHTPEDDSPGRAVFPRNMPYQWFSRFLGVMHTQRLPRWSWDKWLSSR